MGIINKDKVTAVVPCRKGSQRVINKNTRTFAGFSFGLLELKLKQLAASKQIDEILVTTNDPVVIDIVEQLKPTLSKSVIIDQRPDEYSSDDSLQFLIAYLGNTVETDVLVWTHVTSPLFGTSLYDKAIIDYQQAKIKKTADSLIAVDVVQTFAMRSGNWISHDYHKKRWPRTQDLEKIYLVNSALFIIDHALLVNLQDRVGNNPLLFETPNLLGFDIDWEDDFSLAEILYNTFTSRIPSATNSLLAG